MNYNSACLLKLTCSHLTSSNVTIKRYPWCIYFLMFYQWDTFLTQYQFIKFQTNSVNITGGKSMDMRCVHVKRSGWTDKRRSEFSCRCKWLLIIDCFLTNQFSERMVQILLIFCWILLVLRSEGNMLNYLHGRSVMDPVWWVSHWGEVRSLCSCHLTDLFYQLLTLGTSHLCPLLLLWEKM